MMMSANMYCGAPRGHLPEDQGAVFSAPTTACGTKQTLSKYQLNA